MSHELQGRPGCDGQLWQAAAPCWWHCDRSLDGRFQTQSKFYSSLNKSDILLEQTAAKHFEKCISSFHLGSLFSIKIPPIFNPVWNFRDTVLLSRPHAFCFDGHIFKALKWARLTLKKTFPHDRFKNLLYYSCSLPSCSIPLGYVGSLLKNCANNRISIDRDYIPEVGITELLSVWMMYKLVQQMLTWKYSFQTCDIG